ncbi:MAG: Hpt domain-containing protein [Phycisphaerales bacterium]|nr:Hpt domain-containing protein [Phycisphaerales bacterium]
MNRSKVDNGNAARHPLISEFANDADMAELIEFFLSELDHRLQVLQAAWDTGNLEQVQSLSHQLKGAAGGYGFPSISEVAAELEHALAIHTPGSTLPRDRFESLMSQLRRAQAGAHHVD